MTCLVSYEHESRPSPAKAYLTAYNAGKGTTKESLLNRPRPASGYSNLGTFELVVQELRNQKVFVYCAGNRWLDFTWVVSVSNVRGDDPAPP